ncbi:MAG: hypothetical protein B1H02_02595 [Candidatus Latescibacteria bacterium 4484_107]|nr:MAG: hypothetical protein B1H02_02595 [Candidatus Latescibacteria bacterium 4484_107]
MPFSAIRSAFAGSWGYNPASTVGWWNLPIPRWIALDRGHFFLDFRRATAYFCANVFSSKEVRSLLNLFGKRFLLTKF